nr:arginase family protein [Conyzicola lurida]
MQDGAEAIRGDLPASFTRVVDVPMEAGDELGSGLPRLGSLQLVRDRMLAELATVPDRAISIGGDCGIALAAVEHVVATTEERVAVLWFDAHPDLNTVATSPSGAFSGMVLRTLLGDGVAGLVPSRTVSPSSVVLAGTRSTDEGEEEYIVSSGITRVGAEQLADPATLVAAVTATGASSVFIHIDLDVFDPADITGVGDPVPFGVDAATLAGSIRAVSAEFSVVGASIAGFSPSSPDAATDDLPTILRLIGALTA